MCREEDNQQTYHWQYLNISVKNVLIMKIGEPSNNLTVCVRERNIVDTLHTYSMHLEEASSKKQDLCFKLFLVK